MSRDASDSSPPARPRVLQVITRLGLGGAEAVAFSLMRGLRDEFDFACFAVRGVESGDLGRALQAQLQALAIPLYCGPRWPLRLGGMVPAGLRAGQVVRQFRPGLLHLHTEIPESTYAALAALRPGVAPGGVVRTIHTSAYWDFWPQLGRWCERRLGPSRVAAVSTAALAAFHAHRAGSGAGPLPVPATVIYNGVGEPAPATAVPRAPGDRLRVLFAGRFESEKGADLLPQILAQVQPPAPGAELVLHGRGRHERRLRALAARPPAGWTVQVRPPCADLRARLAEFDLVLLPSRAEGLGLVAIEAARAGRPVVATGIAGLREALPADYPWLAPAGDAAGFARELQRALGARATWPAVAARADAFARQRFDLAAMLAAYAQLYRAADRGAGPTA